MPVGDPDLPDDARAEGRPTGAAKRRMRSEAEISVSGARPLTSDHGYLVEFDVKAPKGADVAVTAVPSARTADGRMPLEPDEYWVKWGGHCGGEATERTVIYRNGGRGQLMLRTRTSIAVDLDFRMEVSG